MANTDAELAYSLYPSGEHSIGYATLNLEELSLLPLTPYLQRNVNTDVMYKVIYPSYPIIRHLVLKYLIYLSNLDWKFLRTSQISLELITLHLIGSSKILQVRRLLFLFITSALTLSILTSSHLNNINIDDYTWFMM